MAAACQQPGLRMHSAMCRLSSRHLRPSQRPDYWICRQHPRQCPHGAANGFALAIVGLTVSGVGSAIGELTATAA